MTPQIKFDFNQIQELADRYDYRISESEIIRVQKSILDKGYLTGDDLKAVAYWKAPRSSANAAKNPEGYVEEVTGFALATPSERARIESLTILDGVRWPTASVILHLFHREPYPIMDYRALWSFHWMSRQNTHLASGGHTLISVGALRKGLVWI